MQISDAKMRPNTGGKNVANSDSKARGGRAKVSPNSPVDGRKGRNADAKKSNSGKRAKKNDVKKQSESRASELDTAVTDAGTDKLENENEMEAKEDSARVIITPRLSMSTPRRKRAGLLDNLRSDLSPKYIGFTTPSPVVKIACDSSDSESVLRTRSSRRRKKLNSTASPEMGFSDSEVAAEGASTALLGCVRRARNKEVVARSPEGLILCKHFESPIDKLLARNGSTTISARVLDDATKVKLVRNLKSCNDEKLPDPHNEYTADSDKPVMTDVNISEESVVDFVEVGEENKEEKSEKEPNESTETSTQPEEENKQMSVENHESNNGMSGAADVTSDTLSNIKADETELKQDNCAFQPNVKRDNSTEHLQLDEGQNVGEIIKRPKISIRSKESLQLDDNCPEQLVLDEDQNGGENIKRPKIRVRSKESLQLDDQILVTIKKENDDNFQNNEDCISDNNISSMDNSLLADVEDAHSAFQLELANSRNDSSSISNNAVSMSAKSPSAMSLDSAKGSSVVTGVAWISFSTGDLFWGQIYSYCYWPCMVCPDPDGKTITRDRNVRTYEEHVLVHVRFFADSGRRNWVKKENLIPYTDLESYKMQLREVRKKHGRKSLKYKLMLPKQAKVNIWREAIKEANKVAEVLYTERLEKFFEIYEYKKALQKLQKKRRQSSTDMGSLPESMDSLIVKNPLAAVKRDRSSSPYSPAYSPLKPVADIKRRKLSETAEDEPPQSSTNIADETNFVEDARNNGLMNAVDVAVNTSTTSFTALHEMEMTSNKEYRKFFAAMKDFVLENNQDENLERSLVVAARNIWALKQINHRQIQRRLLASFNENELGSSLIESGRAEGTVKRLSNRLKSIMARRSVNTTQISIAESEPRKVEDESNRNIVPRETKPKRPLNRPIEEVIDDIFSLDNRYLFKGMAREPVCKYCFEPSGQLLKCSKGCQSWLHVECIGKFNGSTVSNKSRRSRRRTKSISNNWHRDSTQTEDGKESKVNTTDNSEETTADISPSVSPTYHVTSDNSNNGKESVDPPIVLEVMCAECALNKPSVCSVCSSFNNLVNDELVMCTIPQCCKSFHPTCCRYWPQAKFTKSNNKIESFRCPSHVCHTCVSDDPKGKFQHLRNAKLTKCVKCPASYHTDSTCIPAGSQVLTAAYIICPRHTSAKSDAHVNVSWCFICVGGGQVICCETCPTAVHAECLNIPLDPNEGYICEECESGRLPLYGEMVWAKFNSFRWWPAIILPPTEVPQNIMRKAHTPHDFVVRFFGTHDHGWISRRRVYLYLEGDSSEPPKTKSYLDQSYNRGVEEAKRVYEIIKLKKQKQNLSNEVKVKLHPQPYVRIKANRAVLPVKLHVDMEKVNKCECNPDAEDPCGPNSNCLNRVLYHECNPKICPAGDRCQNQMFESKISPRLDVVYMKERGFGLVCREPISAGTFVIEYVGEIINDNEFQQRMSQKSLDRDENFYFLSVEKDYIIDAGPKGNLARFMNHSCDPNCETQKWCINGLNRVGLFAIKDIPADTELTFNYHWDDLLGGEKKICYCGASKCAGQIGSKYKEDKPLKDLTDDINVKEKANVKRKTKSKSRKKQLSENKKQRKTPPKLPKLSTKDAKKVSKILVRSDLLDDGLTGKNETAAAAIAVAVENSKISPDDDKTDTV